MNKGIHLAAMMVAGIAAAALAGNNAGQGSGTKSGTQATSQSSGAQVSGSMQGPGTSEGGSIEDTPEARKRKEARAMRHDAIVKAQKLAIDSAQATFTAHEIAEEAGTSAIVNEKIQAEKDSKAGKGDPKPSNGK